MRRPRGPLWHNGDFLLLWGAQSVSELGSQVTGLALPLAAIFVVHATTFEVAALNVVDLLPWALFSLPVGVWVDRLRRRPLMIAADWGRTAALGSIPVVYAFGGLTLAQLYRRRLCGRNADRVLRRLVPVVPPCSRRARTSSATRTRSSR